MISLSHKLIICVTRRKVGQDSATVIAELTKNRSRVMSLDHANIDRVRVLSRSECL
jgi:hypothetical protein